MQRLSALAPIDKRCDFCRRAGWDGLEDYIWISALCGRAGWRRRRCIEGRRQVYPNTTIGKGDDFLDTSGSCFIPHGLACLAHHHVDGRQPRLLNFARQVTDLALDPVECSTLAKSLALRLTDGLADGIIAPPNDDKDTTHSLASVGWGAGEGDV